MWRQRNEKIFQNKLVPPRLLAERMNDSLINSLSKHVQQLFFKQEGFKYLIFHYSFMLLFLQDIEKFKLNILRTYVKTLHIYIE